MVSLNSTSCRKGKKRRFFVPFVTQQRRKEPCAMRLFRRGHQPTCRQMLSEGYELLSPRLKGRRNGRSRSAGLKITWMEMPVR